MTFLNKTVVFRLREIEFAELESIVNKNQDRFENVSHFVRCAVIRHLREWRDDVEVKESNQKWIINLK